MKPKPKNPTPHRKGELFDVFVSHASEDKKSFVQPLARALEAFGVKVWYDEFSLRAGERLGGSIDQGLAQSKCGILVLSPAFFTKQWTEYEFKALMQAEKTAKKIILTILHRVTPQEVSHYSPALADKLAIRTENATPVQIAAGVIKIIRPDIFTRILRRMVHYQRSANAESSKMRTAEILPSPIQHKALPPELISRVRLVCAALLGAYTHSMEFWLEGFQRDAHPSGEIAWWEHVAAVYREYLSLATCTLTNEQHEAIVQYIIALSEDGAHAVREKLALTLPEDALEMIEHMYRNQMPYYDIDEASPWAAQEPKPSKEGDAMYADLDQENLLHDLPENLVRELMSGQEPSASEPRKRTSRTARLRKH